MSAPVSNAPCVGFESGLAEVLEQGWTPGVGEVAARYDIYTMEEVSVI